MFKNYLKTALRSLLKNKGFTFINVIGLALGLAACLLIVFYVTDEMSYDRFNSNANRIYRVNMDLRYGGTVSSFAVSEPPLAATLMNNFTEVDKATRLIQSVGTQFKKGTEHISEGKVAYADPNIFDVFTLPFLKGDAKTALAEPHCVVMTERAAKKYFGRIDIVGQDMFVVNENANYKITGVMRNMPQQSHFDFDYLLSSSSLPSSKSDNWNSFSYNTYILFKAGTDAKRFEAKLNNLIVQHFGRDKYAKFQKGGNYIRHNLTALTDIHLRSNRQYELGTNSSITYVYIFSAIALFVLLLACINFMNLSTARSANRAREVGVRKVLGSSRKNLIAQFMSESILVTLTATIIAVAASWLLLPFFNLLSGKDLTITVHLLSWLFPVLVVVVLVVGMLAGSYPALYLSAFQPVSVLKGRLSTGFKGSRFRNILVVTQFSISIFLIIGTLVIYNQLNYIQHKDLGYNRGQVMVIKNMAMIDDAQTLKQEIKQLPGVANATLSSFIPTGSFRQPDAVFSNPVVDAKNALFTEIWPIDEDYLSTMGMSLATGRNFDKDVKSDSTCVIINQTAARMLGYANNPLNKKIYHHDDATKSNKAYTVIGVVKDFNFSSLRDNITPVVMLLGHDKGALSVKLNAKNVAPSVTQIERKWNAASPNLHLEYSFMDQDFDAAYRFEQRTGKLFLAFTLFAVVIACLGLFGLAAYAAEQRNREIGIRKVLGANVSTVVALLSKDFIKLVAIAIIIATPLAWFAMNKWLQGFAYRQEIQWWVLAITAFGSTAIAFITISFQSIKAALANPVDSLRGE